MYAIVDVAGQQFKVTKDQKIFVHRLDGKEGNKIEFDKVLLIDNNDKVKVGEPIIKGALIKGKILKHLKGDKVKVFKKKRRKGYKVLKGHRDHITHVLIEEINEKATETTKTATKTRKPAAKTTKTKTSKSTKPKKQTAAKKTTSKTTAKAQSQSSTKKTSTTKGGTKKTTTKKKQTGTTGGKKTTKKTSSEKKTNK